MAQLRHLQTGIDATVGVGQCRIYKCGASVVTSFVRHFLLFSCALVWMCPCKTFLHIIQSVLLYVLVCKNIVQNHETNTFQNVGSKFVGPCSAKQSQHSLCTVTEYLFAYIV